MLNRVNRHVNAINPAALFMTYRGILVKLSVVTGRCLYLTPSFRRSGWTSKLWMAKWV